MTAPLTPLSEQERRDILAVLDRFASLPDDADFYWNAKAEELAVARALRIALAQSGELTARGEATTDARRNSDTLSEGAGVATQPSPSPALVGEQEALAEPVASVLASLATYCEQAVGGGDACCESCGQTWRQRVVVLRSLLASRGGAPTKDGRGTGDTPWPPRDADEALTWVRATPEIGPAVRNAFDQLDAMLAPYVARGDADLTAARAALGKAVGAIVWNLTHEIATLRLRSSKENADA